MARFIHQSNCRLCHGTNVELVVKLDPVPLAEKYTTDRHTPDENGVFPTDLYLCRDCGHVQILDIIDSDKLWDDYTYHSAQTRGIVEHFETVADQVVHQRQPKPGSLVIDVGSNDGSLLRPFKTRGYRVLGIDPATEIARKATASGIETIPALMTPALAQQITAKHGHASVVTAFNVFAHAADMRGMAQSIHDMLAPDGIFVFEVQYLLDILDKMLLGTIFHEHMSHHSVKPMKLFLERHGMELIDVERVNIQKGSLIGTAQRKGGPRPVQPSVQALLNLEQERKLDRPETIRQFGSRLAEMKKTMGGLIAEWKRRGATVAGYGAARSGPTFIVQFGLGDVIEYLLDDHPQKVGKFSPLNRFPVLPTKELLIRQPDYVVILAWIHARKIIADNQAYLAQGGHFVVCCPNIQVIGAGDTAPVL